jgi:phosphoribosylformylglycinamidine synthase
LVFHKETSLGAADFVIVPGGFAHGDYLRCGAIARFSPIADAIVAFAKRGGPVLGICNGFQVLTEMGLLPGALVRNASQRFECRDVWLSVTAHGRFTRLPLGSVLRLPIAHGEGRYHADDDLLARLEGEERIAFRYVAADGGAGGNPNGSKDDVAGVYDERKNVLGLMPHPERASEAILGNADGRKLFESLLA